jgi:hypothetical protein
VEEIVRRRYGRGGLLLDEREGRVEGQMLAALPAIEGVRVVAQQQQTVLLRLPVPDRDHKNQSKDQSKINQSMDCGEQVLVDKFNGRREVAQNRQHGLAGHVVEHKRLRRRAEEAKEKSERDTERRRLFSFVCEVPARRR